MEEPEDENKTMGELMLVRRDKKVGSVERPEQSEQRDSPNLIVYMSGIGVTHNTGESWQTVFLDGISRHPLKVEAYKREGINRHRLVAETAVGHEPGRQIKLDIPVITAMPTQSHTLGEESIENILDFSSPLLHGSPVEIVQPNGISLTKFEVKGGYAFTADYAASDWSGAGQYCLLKPNESEASDPFRLGSWIGIAFNVEKGRTAKLDVINSSAMNVAERLPFNGDEIYEVCVYNHCDEGLNEIDFPYYYNAVCGGKSGIVCMPPVVMRYLGKTIEKRRGGRVDCNLMRVSEIKGGKDLFTTLNM